MTNIVTSLAILLCTTHVALGLQCVDVKNAYTSQSCCDDSQTEFHLPTEWSPSPPSYGTGLTGKLKVWLRTIDPDPVQNLNNLIHLFEASHPDIAVELVPASGAQGDDQIYDFLDLPRGDAPDIVSWKGGASMRTLVDRGSFMEVSDVWNDKNLSYYMASSEAAVTANGRQYGIPYGYYPWVLYYRKDLFQEHSLQPPQTFDDLVSLCTTFRDKNIIPLVAGTKNYWPAAAHFDYLNFRLHGYDFHMQLMEGKVPYTDSKVRQTFAKWKVLLDNQCYNDDHATLEWSEAFFDRLTQTNSSLPRAAMILNGAWASRNLYAYGVHFLVDQVRYPRLVDGMPNVEEAPTDTYHILSNAANVEEAKAFLRFLSTVEAQRVNAGGDDMSILPVHRDVRVPDNPFLQKDKEILASASATTQFYDRDTHPEMASEGMNGFQEFMLHPDRMDSILQRLEGVRQRVYGDSQSSGVPRHTRLSIHLRSFFKDGNGNPVNPTQADIDGMHAYSALVNQRGTLHNFTRHMSLDSPYITETFTAVNVAAFAQGLLEMTETFLNVLSQGYTATSTGLVHFNITGANSEVLAKTEQTPWSRLTAQQRTAFTIGLQPAGITLDETFWNAAFSTLHLFNVNFIASQDASKVFYLEEQ